MNTFVILRRALLRRQSLVRTNQRYVGTSSCTRMGPTPHFRTLTNHHHKLMNTSAMPPTARFGMDLGRATVSARASRGPTRPRTRAVSRLAGHRKDHSLKWRFARTSPAFQTSDSAAGRTRGAAATAAAAVSVGRAAEPGGARRGGREQERVRERRRQRSRSKYAWPTGSSSRRSIVQVTLVLQ